MSRLWTAYVLGWALVPLVSAGFLVTSRPPASRLALEILGVGSVAALYLWVGLRESLGPDDFDPGGPSRVRVRRRLLLLGGMSLLVIALSGREPETESWWLAQNVVVAAGLALPLGLAARVIGGVTALTLVGTWYLLGHPVLVTLILLAFGASAIAVRQLTITVAQLYAARDELAKTAVDQERLRFARDLHDLLGHSLSLVVLKSELAARLLPVAPDRAAREIRDVERSAREALQQVRTAVAGYRQPVLARELEAARELLGAAGIASTVDESAGALPAAMDGLLAWAVREGVTNVIRHSHAKRCEIRIRQNGGGTELSVLDDGLAGSDEAPKAGSGLPGLAERANGLGASVSAGALPDGGFRLLVSVPAVGATEEEVE